MAASDIPAEAISDYLESLACKMVEGGIPADRVISAMNLTALRVHGRYSASIAEPTKVSLDFPPDVPRFAAVLERLQAQANPEAPEQVQDRPERRKAGRPWWKPASEAEASEAPEETETQPVTLNATRRGTGSEP